MIDEHMEDQASLHMLGALTPEEAVLFKKALQSDPELQAYVARLSVATGAVAGSVPLMKPPPELRAKILDRIAPSRKIVQMSEPGFRMIHWIPWALAACLAILCAVFYSRDATSHKIMAEQQQQIGELNQLALTLQTSTNNLQKAVVALQESSRLANLRVAMLNSLVANKPKTVAVTLWDTQRQDGVFVGQNMAALPSDKDYELWVIDENHQPVAAGIFHVENNGSIRMEFKPTRMIKTASQFAVTEEVKGGVSSPTIKNMVLASN